MNNTDFLPIGSVCTIENEQNNVMIAGFAIKLAGKIYDYIGVIHPIGMIDKLQCKYFNKEDVVEVLFKGYETDKHPQFITELKNYINKDK